MGSIVQFIAIFQSLKFQLLLYSHSLPLFLEFYLKLNTFGIRMKLLLLFITLIPLLNPSAAHGGVSGEMQVEEQIKGLISVSQLSEGDVIRGITGIDQTPDWCRVEAVVPLSQDQTTYDGFTENHMVVDDTVHPYGTKGKMRKGPVFTLATECEAAVNSAGQAFTPISTLLCPLELSWDEYLPLIAAVRQAILLTDNFWYNLNVYHDDETAGVLDWSDQSHDVCSELLQCTREGHAQCQTFEEVMERFVREHLNKKHVKNVEQAFPDMSDNDDGTITEVHGHAGRRNRVLLLSSVGTGMVLLGLILVVGLLMYHRRMAKKKAKKEVELDNSLVKAGDVKA